MHRYQILIEYVGSNFFGWQIQSKGKSIQKSIQVIISKILKEKIKIIGSGRTDSGVHAIQQSAHFDSKNKIKNLDKFLQSINYFLNKKLISIIDVKKKINRFNKFIVINYFSFTIKMSGLFPCMDTGISSSRAYNFYFFF